MATDSEVKDLKVGDNVEFKFDIEQCGTIEKIGRDAFGKKVFYVRAFDGGYVDSIDGTVIGLSARDIWLD